ncbi:MAG: asparagine synthase (glutamine-hydrolyzing) [Planctomycetota bacterium]|nr:asparagine synthase (glutamine-hydrolyzing) [Planctomycetota bacterium]
MCGITGAVWTNADKRISPEVLSQMTHVIQHRGPDDQGFFVENLGCDGRGVTQQRKGSAGVALGFRRLSIIDLTDSRQPISNEDGSIQAIFNGEIYNYRDLRQQLIQKGHRFKTNGDSETIVHLYEELGVDCFAEFNGCFAIAIWDSIQQKLVLGRDRLGQKPLQYRHEGDRLLFGSELKSLLQVPDIPREINKKAIEEYLVYQYVPHPHSILKGFNKLAPGHYGVYEGNQFHVEKYWHPSFEEDRSLTEEQAGERLDELFNSSIKLRMQSDVPLGAFLSGGVDSSLVVASMVQQSSRKIQTFSIGFPIKEFDESRFAKQVSEYLGTEHHNFTVTPDADSILDELVFLYDEPFADSSAIPTWYVSKLTREHVTVALSGDGGDELFAGYDRYRAVQLAEKIDKLGPLKHLFSAKFWQKIPSSAQQKSRIRQLKRFSYALGLPALKRYCDWIAIFNEDRRQELFNDEFKQSLGRFDPLWFLKSCFDRLENRDALTAVSVTDLQSYLPGDLNTKVDIASMGHGLEARQPFLDHRLVEFAITLPARMKFRSGKGKRLLKKTFGKRLPANIWNRPKMGFGVPIGEWFRSELKPRLQETLLSPDAACLEYFSAAQIQKLVKEHQDRVVDHSYRLWAIMMFELWIQRWLKN